MNGVEGSVLVLEEYIGYEDFLRVATEKGWIKACQRRLQK